MRSLCFIVLLALPVTLLAQMQIWLHRGIATIPPIGQSFQNPTNIAGSPPAVQWVAADYYTNSGVPTITNRWYANTTWSLTNKGASSVFPIGSSNLNGHATVLFDDAVSSYLECAPFSATQPQEIFMVMYWDTANNSGNNSYLFDGTSAVNRNFGHQQGSTTYWTIGAVTETDDPGFQMDYGNWLVMDMVFTTTGVSSLVITNNVQYSSGSVGALSMTGFTLGVDNALANPAAMQIAEIIVYPSLLSAANRTSNYNYYTNFYKIRQP